MNHEHSRNSRNGPWWAQGWRGILTLGPLAVIALILVGTVLGLIPSPLTRLDAHIREQGEATRLLRLICVSTARTDEMRERCAGSWPGQW